MSSTRICVDDVILEAKEVLKLVVADAEKRLQSAIDSGAINLNDPKYTEILVGKIIAKACLNSAVDYLLDLDKAEKEVKNLNKMI